MKWGILEMIAHLWLFYWRRQRMCQWCLVHSIFIKRFTKARQNKTKQNKSKAKQKEKSKGNGSKRITEACQIKILTDPHGRLRWGVIKRACGNHAVFFSSNQICGDCFPANSVKWIQGPGLLDGGWFLHVVRFLSQRTSVMWKNTSISVSRWMHLQNAI